MSETPMTPERLAEIRGLLKYESSIEFYSSRAKESMLLLVAEAEEAARMRAELAARPSRAEVLAEAADDLEAQTCGCGCRRGADLLRYKADEAGKDTGPSGESAQPAEQVVYRAECAEITLGHYTTEGAARAHCETYVRRQLPGVDLVFDWFHGEDDPMDQRELHIETDGSRTATLYTVVPLTVASEYDPDGDE